MSYFSIKELFENEINEIWRSFSKIEICQRGYALQDEILKSAIMFIGINPSFNLKTDKNGCSFYNVNQEGKSHNYFNKFKEIAKSCNQSWTHFDLLFFRETNQKYIIELLNNPEGVNFIFQQLIISKKIIERAKPKVLIISNTMARQFMGFDKNIKLKKGVWMGFDFAFDDIRGTHKIINHIELENTPVFFTSMLTGQRALDKGSFERLKWHVKMVLEKSIKN